MTSFVKFLLNQHEKLLCYHISWRHLLINKIFNSVFNVNRDGKYMVHYTSTINGMNNIRFNGNPHTILLSMAASGNCYIGIENGYFLDIGEGTIWAPNVCIRTGNHGLINRDITESKNVIIGKNCWLGFGSVILPGVELGDNVTVGANAVVTKSFGNNVVIAGVPAVVVKQL